MDLGIFIYAIIGFIAQLVDSALGMAFGSISSLVFCGHWLSASIYQCNRAHGGNLWGQRIGGFSLADEKYRFHDS